MLNTRKWHFHLLSCAECPKIVNSLWANISKELHDNPANGDATNGDVKKDPWSFDSHSETVIGPSLKGVPNM